jgi:hypothetical protein
LTFEKKTLRENSAGQITIQCSKDSPATEKHPKSNLFSRPWRGHAFEMRNLLAKGAQAVLVVIQVIISQDLGRKTATEDNTSFSQRPVVRSLLTEKQNPRIDSQTG